MPLLHYDPVLRLLLANGADFEAVVLLLGRDGPGIDGVHQDVLDYREIPHIPPIFRVFLLPFGADIAQAPFPVPPCGAGHLLFLQPAPDEVGAVSLQRPKEDLPDNGGGFLVHQQVVSVLRVFPIPKGGHAAGKLALLGFQQIRGMHLLGNILAIHLVQDILKGRNVVVLPQGVDPVIHGDVAHTVPGEEVLNEIACLQVVPAQPGEVFGNDKVDLSALDGLYHPFQVGALHVQPRVAIVLIDCHNLPSLLFAVVFQHIPLVGNAGALPVQIIVLGKPAIDGRPEAARQNCIHACIFISVHHNRLPAQSRRNTVLLNLVFIIS